MHGPSCSVGLAHSPPSWQLSLAAPPLARVGAESQRTLIPAACAKDFDAETDPRVPASRSTQTHARQMNSRQGEAADVATGKLGHTWENQLWIRNWNQERHLRGRGDWKGWRGLRRMKTQVGQHWGIRDTGKIDGHPAVGSGLCIAAVEPCMQRLEWRGP